MASASSLGPALLLLRLALSLSLSLSLPDNSSAGKQTNLPQTSSSEPYNASTHSIVNAAVEIVVDSRDQTVAVGSQARFFCETAADSNLGWRVNLPGLGNAFLDYDQYQDAMQAKGIRVVSELRNRSTTLMVNATLENNGTRVRCIAIGKNLENVEGNAAILLVFGE